ncbi:chaperonin CPN60-2, mitochondrial [Artemisia annua]|uniref:Chaperonin CPN60-2, mitochondrial n=1 Tax=Artemisia annua TaxID=35608 RepID=A0A2U1LYG9_ARTAN|nr:chaperonin CPN60-2, mitochondrial [Artemisia annua]
MLLGDNFWGCNAVIERNYGALKVNKYGVTVAKTLKFKDEVKNVCTILVNSQVANAPMTKSLLSYSMALLF